MQPGLVAVDVVLAEQADPVAVARDVDRRVAGRVVAVAGGIGAPSDVHATIALEHDAVVHDQAEVAVALVHPGVGDLDVPVLEADGAAKLVVRALADDQRLLTATQRREPAKLALNRRLRRGLEAVEAAAGVAHERLKRVADAVHRDLEATGVEGAMLVLRWTGARLASIHGLIHQRRGILEGAAALGEVQAHHPDDEVEVAADARRQSLRCEVGHLDGVVLIRLQQVADIQHEAVCLAGVPLLRVADLEVGCVDRTPLPALLPLQREAAGVREARGLVDQAANGAGFRCGDEFTVHAYLHQVVGAGRRGSVDPRGQLNLRRLVVSLDGADGPLARCSDLNRRGLLDDINRLRPRRQHGHHSQEQGTDESFH